MTTSFERHVSSGTIVQGKWNHRQYKIERLLGAGANGQVYLVKRGKLSYALKTGFDAVDHQSEVNALKTLSKSGTSYRNYLLDVDDFHCEGQDFPFYIMPYMKGQSMADFMKQNGRDWIYLIGLNLLRKLVELHGEGYIFSDIKMENVIVSGYGDVELIDFGGVTPKGRAVKQFTEVYDRGFWGAGSRSADEAYDLFAFAVLLISSTDTGRRLAGIKKVIPQNRSVDMLLEMLQANRALSHAAPVLRKALLGQYATSKEALADWRKGGYPKPAKIVSSIGGAWLKICFAASLLLFGLTVYLYWPAS
ncbi:serine/threonine protein kinase [Paenibacillus doosanensis]|uniref:protein kinase domain-containing protein n=1 Tax=Paenibacillus doosanensis TaxID=1229154 RepID=UPI00217F4F81|nr:serine/threonine protein kinase [Paenibacillus doosanensis]MCS7463190.1 serine/threonine protein kinase [Paenibacillus doosanensis]